MPPPATGRHSSCRTQLQLLRGASEAEAFSPAAATSSGSFRNRTPAPRHQQGCKSSPQHGKSSPDLTTGNFYSSPF